MSLINDAIARRNARPEPRRIDYDRMNRVGPRAAIAEWDEIGAWPDDWSRWQRALSDALPWNVHVDIADL